MTAQMVDLPVAVARVNWGRWVADCPVCPSAMKLDPGQVVFVCGDELCRRPAVVSWPADPGAVDALLAQRPDPRNRNWSPVEALHDLLEENIAHGVMPRPEGL